jgi:hypothetical protein
VVGSVKAGAFEDDADRLEHLAQALLRAFRAAGQRSIAELLLAVKLDTTIFAPVSIDRHRTPRLQNFSINEFPEKSSRKAAKIAKKI